MVVHIISGIACMRFPTEYNNTSGRMGKKIQNYLLQNLIGEGEFGKVYRATDEKTNQTVAIKIIKIEKFKLSPKLEEFTINEIQTLSKIEDTTHVVRFIEILKTANNYYFVYEYCNGGTLEQQIKLEGRLNEEKAVGYFRDLLKAFQILSKSNIMHRDIKPSNILLNNGIIKLADFGFCKPLKDSKDLSQTMLGSPIYMAPQVLKGEAYTMKADIWSLGVVLYQMLYGFCPFEEKTIARLISLIDQSTVLFPTNVKISKRLEQLLRRILVKDQFKRITWQDLLNFDFEAEGKTKPQAISSSTGGNPFSRKTNFTSLIPQEPAKNRFLTTIEYNNRPESCYKTSKYTTTLTMGESSKENIYNPAPDLRKKQSKAAISPSDRKLLQSALQNRQKIRSGVQMIRELLTQNSSKLTVYLCCYLARKVKVHSRQAGEMIKKVNMDKQNKEKTSELKMMVTLLNEQKQRVDEKLAPFEVELIQEPHDIVFLKYAEEEGLTQQKEGLLKLIEIFDYLNDSRWMDYSRCAKKQLVEEYEKRILRKP